jgi:hypothetical protein
MGLSVSAISTTRARCGARGQLPVPGRAPPRFAGGVDASELALEADELGAGLVVALLDPVGVDEARRVVRVRPDRGPQRALLVGRHANPAKEKCAV